MIVHCKMIRHAYVTQAFDREVGGLPASHEFLGSHRSSEVAVLRKLAPGCNCHEEEKPYASHARKCTPVIRVRTIRPPGLSEHADATRRLSSSGMAYATRSADPASV